MTATMAVQFVSSTLDVAQTSMMLPDQGAVCFQFFANDFLIRGLAMTDGLHPMAPHHLPSFISGPTEGDPLYVLVTLIVLAGVIGLGVLFFTLHSLPERMGHKKLQFEIVAVLGLLSLFTHIHAFWVAALLLALIDLPDFISPLKRMAAALEKQNGIPSPPEDAPAASDGDHTAPPKSHAEAPVPSAVLAPAAAPSTGA
jgi:hypothetical protein